MKRYFSQIAFSAVALIAGILAVSATVTLAQPADGPVDALPEASRSDGQPAGRHRVEFLNDCGGAGRCADAAQDSFVDAISGYPVPAATVHIFKNAVPADGTNFTFSSAAGDFTLDDAVPDDGDAFGENAAFQVESLISGQVVEQPPQFWSVASIICTYSDESTTVSAVYLNESLVGVSINPAPEDEITCTFNNHKGSPNDKYFPFLCNTCASP